MTYNDLKYLFKIEAISFQVSTISLGRISEAVPAHSHGRGCYEIHYNVSGSGTVIADGKSYRLRENTLYTTGPGVIHEQISDHGNPITEYCIYLRVFPESWEGIRKNSFLLPFSKQPFWLGDDTQNLLPLFHTIFQELERKRPGYQSLLEALFKQLVIFIARDYLEADAYRPMPETSESDRNFLLAVERAFLNEYRTLTLEQLAGQINLSARQTERLLKQYYNSTFIRKRTEARVGAACVLLKSTELPVGEIAEMVGYSSSEHFSHAFKTCMGISAREFRKQREHSTQKKGRGGMVKEGTTVFYIDEDQVHSGQVIDVTPQTDGFTFSIDSYGTCEGQYVINSGQIGKTVFFTEEDAYGQLKH